MERKLKNVQFLQKYCGLKIREYQEYERDDIRRVYDFINNAEISAKTKKSNKLKIKRAFDGHRMYDSKHIILTSAQRNPPKILLPKFKVNVIFSSFNNDFLQLKKKEKNEQLQNQKNKKNHGTKGKSLVILLTDIYVSKNVKA